jgi:hypothetical protein
VKGSKVVGFSVQGSRFRGLGVQGLVGFRFQVSAQPLVAERPVKSK